MTDALGPEAGPVVEEYRQTMTQLAAAIDDILNGDKRPKSIGFCLLMFPFGDAASPDKERLNYISNADALDMKAMFKEMIARFEYRYHREHKA